MIMVISNLIFYDVYLLFALITSRIFHLDYVHNNVKVCCTILHLKNTRFSARLGDLLRLLFLFLIHHVGIDICSFSSFRYNYRLIHQIYR